MRTFMVNALSAVGCYMLLISALSAQEPSVFRTFKIGNDAVSVGINPGTSNEYGEEPLVGPQALVATYNGNLLLLDQINNRILSFSDSDPNALPVAMELPADLEPTDLVSIGPEIYVWDEEAWKVKLPASSGPNLRLSSDRATTADREVLSEFAIMGSQETAPDLDVLERPMDRSADLSTPVVRTFTTFARKSVQVEVVPSADSRSATVRIQSPTGDYSTTIDVQVQDTLGILELLQIDKNGEIFLLVENLNENQDSKSSVVIARYDSAGSPKTTYNIPISESASLPRRFVTVASDGRVFFLKQRTDAVDILILSEEAMRRGYRLGSIEPSSPAQPDAQPSERMQPRSRQEMVATALPFASTRWKVIQSAYGTDPVHKCVGFDNRRIRPWYLEGKLNQIVEGIPYCWGCKNSVQKFLQEIQNGKRAGNICTNEDPKAGFVGVDCSAFVSEVWGLPAHYTTRKLHLVSEPIANARRMLPGDALNKPGSHVRLFLGFTRDRKVQVIEAATTSCKGRVCQNTYILSGMLDSGFKPIRYRGVTQ